MITATWKLYAYLNSVWTDITSDVLGETSAEWGEAGNTPIDFVADTGSLEFDLDNYTLEGKYTYGHPNALSGWKKGVPVKQVFTFEGEDYVRFRGFVHSLKNAGAKDERKHITAVDWLEYAANHPIVNPGLLTNQRGNQVLTTALGLMPIQPQVTDFDAGINIFPTTFDTVTSKTTAYDEMVKSALSEIGHVYLRKDKLYGETLVFENTLARHGHRTLTDTPLGASDSGAVLKEDGAYLLKEDGGKILLNQVTGLHLDDSPGVLDYDTEDGENIVNRFTIYAMPRRKDTTTQILFQLDAPIAIGSGKTVTIKGYYADPNGGLPVNANPSDMIAPVITTDYRAFVNPDGTGTEFSSSLVVTASYGTEGFTHTVVNNSGKAGWITKFNCRGLGVYKYNPIEHVATDSTSIAEFETQSESISQEYKNDLLDGAIYAATVIEDEKQPRTKINMIYLTANKTSSMMQAFLNRDVGDVIRLTNDKTNTDRYYYIQGVYYRTMPGNIIMFRWIIKQTLTLALGLSMLGIEFRGDGTTDGVDFGPVPYISDLTRRSFSVWIYEDVTPSGTSDTILGIFSDEAGTLISVTTDREIQYYTKQQGPSFLTGIWVTPTNSVPLTTWTHIVVTRDVSNPSANPTTPPIIYINGTLQTLTVTSVALGAQNSEAGSHLIIGNIKTATLDWPRAFDGKIKDVRVYDRILTQAEVTTLYNSGMPVADDITDGLLFQAFAAKTDKLSDYINAALTDSLRVRDVVNSVVGVPHGSPIGRTP